MNRGLPVTAAAALVLLNVAAMPALAGEDYAPPAGPVSQSCDDDPPDDYVQTISAPVDGDELTIQISSRFGGAVDSLTWRGVEFINIYDHGRQISYAWSLDGYGECLNPTEPGSARDFRSPTSTSDLLRVCRDGQNRMTSTTRPAFWLAPGESGFCDGGAVTAVNETLLSDQILTKTMEIGYEGIDNVIAFTAEVSVTERHELMQLEIPTGYLTYEFTDHWVFNPATGDLSRPESLPLTEPWSFVHTGNLPPILATPDGEYAMGAYTAELIEYYSILWFDAPDLANETNKWNMVMRQVPAEPGTYTYRSFAIVGTLESVQEAMTQLYELHPSDFGPPGGYVDESSCGRIAGWAWDPKAPNQPIEVEVYSVEPNGAETLLSSTTADTYRVDLEEALGDSGEHGFHFNPSWILPDGEEYTLRFYAINSDSDLPRRELYESGVTMSCPELGPPKTETPTEAPSDVPTDVATDVPLATAAVPDGIEPTREPGIPVPCLGAVPLAAIGLPLSRRKRSQA